jgi:hypothetical protein
LNGAGGLGLGHLAPFNAFLSTLSRLNSGENSWLSNA